MSSHGVPRTERDRSPDQLKKDLEKIDKYRALEEQLRIQISESRLESATLELTTKLLRINPEYYTVWNIRRRCLISGPLEMKHPRKSSTKHAEPSGVDEKPGDVFQSLPQAKCSENEPKQDRHATSPSCTEPIEKLDDQNELDIKRFSDTIRDELTFTVPLLMGHPKCYWIWNYRMWILEQATSLLPILAAKAIWKEELGLVSEMLKRDRRNYHAWAYRRYVVSQLESTKLEGRSMAESEFAYTTNMINNDLSNFSAWHNRAQLIPRLLVERKADHVSRRAFLDQEFSMVDNGLNVGPEDQSLWYYHQYLTLNVAEQPADLCIMPGIAVDDRIKMINREIDFIKDLLADYADIKWIFEMLLEYTLIIHKLRNESLEEDQKTEIRDWVASIQKLDPQRSNRWKELAEELKISA